MGHHLTSSKGLKDARDYQADHQRPSTKKKPKISESLAKLEEDLFQAKQQGNTRKIKAIESVIRAIKNKNGHRN